MESLITIMLAALAATTCYILIRNELVYKFQGRIIDLSHDYNIRHIETYTDETCAYRWFQEKHTYTQMVFSFNPLKLKAWYTKEEITRIYS